MTQPTQMDRIEQLLTEIRDLLSPPKPSPPALFGYERAQNTPPTQGQVEMARRLLAGELGDSSTKAMPTVAFDLAEEILHRSRMQHRPTPIGDEW